MRRALLPLVVAAAVLSSAGTARAQAENPAESTTSTASQDTDLRGRVESITEQLQTLQADTDKLKRFKFSGYVQGRWEHGERSSDDVRVSGTTLTPDNRDRFYIRRGRIKLTYDSGPLSQAVVYIDGGADRQVRLLEAYVTLLDPWTPDHRHSLTFGQFNVPFGYEIERSSSTRELPERSRAENVLFPGERDRGLKIASQWTPQLETVVAVLNGGGVGSATFPNTDPTRAKDVLGRVRWAQGVVDASVSYSHGRETVALTATDVETDRTRLGGDVQLYYTLPTLGGGSLKGEVYQGTNVNSDSLGRLVSGGALVAGGVSSHLATDFLGGYAMWVQNLGERLQGAARWESFDTNTDLGGDPFERVSVGLNWFYDGNTRVTVAHDFPMNDATIRAGFDNLWTVQVQHRF